MATAVCQNEECDRTEWELTKHPSQYSRGPNCPDCGTTKVEVAAAETPQRGREQPPARGQPQNTRVEGEAQQRGAAPARTDQIPDDESALAMGAQGASILTALDSDDPEERANAYGSGLKALGGLLAQYGDEVAEKKKRQAQRAKETRDEDLQVAQDYPTCPECGAQLHNIPDSREFPCQNCGTRLEFTPGR